MLKKKENKICVIIPVFNEDAVIEEAVIEEESEEVSDNK